jgi:co-chaperonin GroES (HSP10)
MKAARYFVVKATQTHKEREGSIHILSRFENQDKVKQFHKVVAVPKKYQDVVDVGDTLCLHFNIIVYSKKDGVIKQGQYHFQDNLFWIPSDMAHFAIKPDGRYVFFHDDCIVTPKGNSTETVRASGIIMPDLRTETQKKDTNLYGEIFQKSEDMADVEIGDSVCMSKYSDYAIEFPDGETRWFVNRDSVLYKT